MKSELYPGIEFEHTLDGVLFDKYDQFFQKNMLLILSIYLIMLKS